MNRITRRSQQIADQPLSRRKVPEYQSDDTRGLIEMKNLTELFMASKPIKSTQWQ